MALKVLLAGMLSICCYTDWRARKLYNWVTLGGALTAIIMNLFFQGTPGLIDSLAGWAVGCMVLIVPYLLGGIGAGDVKLLAAIGAAAGPSFAVKTFLIAALMGGGFSLVLLVKEKRLSAALKESFAGLSLLVLTGFRVNTMPALQEGTAAVTIPYGLLLGVSTFLLIATGG